MITPDVATNFMYDTEKLSDYELILCRFDSNGMETISIGNNLTFNTVRPASSDKFFLNTSAYSEPLTTTFQICKNPRCENYAITSKELGGVMRWLNRRDGYHKFKLYQAGYEDIFFYGSFSNIQSIKIGGKIVGLEMTFTTDSPYGYLDTVTLDFTTTENTDFTIANFSYETGHLYPSAFICRCLSSGNLIITNSIENRTTEINNCIQDEIITLDGLHKIIQSSVTTHNLYNDFNYNYFRLGNTYSDNLNTITTSLPCQLHIEYSPIRKVGLG